MRLRGRMSVSGASVDNPPIDKSPLSEALWERTVQAGGADTCFGLQALAGVLEPGDLL